MVFLLFVQTCSATFHSYANFRIHGYFTTNSKVFGHHFFCNSISALHIHISFLLKIHIIQLNNIVLCISNNIIELFKENNPNQLKIISFTHFTIRFLHFHQRHIYKTKGGRFNALFNESNKTLSDLLLGLVNVTYKYNKR